MREHFDRDDSVLYLNSGTHSLCPREVLEAITRHQREYERNPSAGLMGVYPRLWGVQTRLARFLNADPRDLMLRINVTHAMNDFIMAVRLPAGSELLVSDLEYGAVANTCRLRAERDGLKLRTFHVPTDADSPELIRAVRSALTAETSLVVLSHVFTGTGLVMPIEAIAAETRARGVLLAIDGAHAPGALPIDFARFADVDFYGGNLHKWLLGPKGTGFGWVNRRVQDRLPPIMGGWTTFDYPAFFGEFGAGSRFAQSHALLGCHDFAPFLAIDAMLEFWERQGAERIRARLGELQNATDEAMRKLGWTLISPARRALRGPLLTYELPAALEARGSALLHELWEAERVQVNVPLVQGRWRLRLSPHVYNTEAEIQEGVRRIARHAERAASR